jgi:hypothetical protein
MTCEQSGMIISPSGTRLARLLWSVGVEIRLRAFEPRHVLSA